MRKLNEMKRQLLEHNVKFTKLNSIFFGGGTPSLLKIEELQELIDAVYRNFNVIENPEITLEANPDDLTDKRILTLSKTRINRLSIGIQSFFEDDLKSMKSWNPEELEDFLIPAIVKENYERTT